MDLIHLCNFGRGYYGKHLYEIILNFESGSDDVEDLIFSSGGHFVQHSKTISIECIVGNIHAKSL